MKDHELLFFFALAFFLEAFLEAFFFGAFFLRADGIGLGLGGAFGDMGRAGGFHGSFSGKFCIEKQTPGLWTCGRGSLRRFMLTAFPQVSFTFMNASQNMNPQNKL